MEDGATLVVLTVIVFVEGAWMIGESALGYPQVVITRPANLDEIPNTEAGCLECVLA